MRNFQVKFHLLKNFRSQKKSYPHFLYTKRHSKNNSHFTKTHFCFFQLYLTHSPGALNWHLGGGWPCDLMRRLSHRPGALNWHLGGGWTCCSELRTHPPPRCHPQLMSCGCSCAVCRGQFPHRY